jgi:MarR family transcriptional regulator, organic hydroperoxide resistance regulator
MPSQATSSTPTILQDIKQSKPFRTKSQEAYVALLRTVDDAKRFVGRVLESEDATLQQYNVLRILRGAGDSGLPTLAVAERMIERTPGVTRLIDRMERKGWVARERCTEDRRRVWCRITPEGLHLLERLNKPMEAVDDALAGALGEDELVDMIGYLDRIRAHMTALES